LLCEAGTAKDWGILAAQAERFKRQCDCFVTTRLAGQRLALKEVTNQLRLGTVFIGVKVAEAVKMKEELLTQRRGGTANFFYFALRRCAAA
jgi:hypothetical protein